MVDHLVASVAAFSAGSSARAASSATTTIKGAPRTPAPPNAALVVVMAEEAALSVAHAEKAGTEATKWAPIRAPEKDAA